MITRQYTEEALSRGLGVEDVTAFIPGMGWTKIDHPSPHLLVYQYKDNDDYGKPIKLVLPAGDDYADGPGMLASAVKLIAALSGRTAKQVRQMLLKRGERAAAKSLRHAKESQETTIRGSVIQLHADPESDEAEDDEECQIIVKCDLGAVRAVKVHASLTADDYRKACDAHKDNREVEIEGRPEKLGKFWNLTSPRNFRVVPR